MIVSMRFLNCEQVVISTKYRVKVVSREIAEQLFELMKMHALKAINAKLYIKAMNDIIEQ